MSTTTDGTTSREDVTEAAPGGSPGGGAPHAPGNRDAHERGRQAAQRGPMGGRVAAIGMPAEKSKDFGAATRRLLAQLAPERWRAVSVLALAVASVTLAVIAPKVLGHATNIIVDGLFGRTHRIDFPDLHRVLVVAVGLYVGSALLSLAQSWILAGVVQRTMYRLREAVEQKLHHLPLGYVDRTPRGDLLSRVTNDIDNVAQSLQQTLSQLLASVLQVVGVLAMMIYISKVLALLAVLTVPASLLILRLVASRSRAKFLDQWRHTGMLNAQVEEAFTGHTLVKVFGRQREVEARFTATNDELYAAGFGAQFISGIIQPAMMFVGNLNYVAIAVVGGLWVSSGRMSLGDVQAFIQYSRQFTMPLTQMASMVNVLQSGIASAERVFEFLDAPEEISDADLPPATGQPRGRVEFEHVRFSYTPDQPLIEDLSLVAEPGQTIAIVGPTGAGKTTLVNLLMRFYELDGGRTTLDGRDISQLRRCDLRSGIGMVLQDTWLFGGSIRDNIAYGNLEATEEQVRAAATAAYVDRFVHSLPDGYDTVLDAEGTSVSAGERQLLTIARAFLADPAILVLDEATSSVDTRTEVLVQKAMARLRSSRTSFVIAHRLSTIRDADTILVMEHGRIVEQGDHSQLLAGRGAYYELYQAQFAGAAAEVA